MTDEQREARIAEVYIHMLAAENEEDFKSLVDFFNELVAGRSPAQVAKMEREMGLV